MRPSRRGGGGGDGDATVHNGAGAGAAALDEIEKAVLAKIKDELGVKKSSSNREPFAKVVVQGKRLSKAAAQKAIRSLSKDGHIRVFSHRFDTTYMPAARTLKKHDDIRRAVEHSLELAGIDLRILSDRADTSTVESLKELDDLVAEFLKAARRTLK